MIEGFCGHCSYEVMKGGFWTPFNPNISSIWWIWTMMSRTWLCQNQNHKTIVDEAVQTYFFLGWTPEIVEWILRFLASSPRVHPESGNPSLNPPRFGTHTHTHTIPIGKPPDKGAVNKSFMDMRHAQFHKPQEFHKLRIHIHCSHMTSSRQHVRTMISALFPSNQEGETCLIIRTAEKWDPRSDNFHGNIKDDLWDSREFPSFL